MKKISFLLILVALLLVATSPAFALNCKTSQSGNSDECWTEVRISPSETYVVSRGTLLVYDLGSTEPYYQVRVSTSSDDGYKVAGFAQAIIPTGDTALVQVRGLGYVQAVNGIASGDRLYPASRAGGVGAFRPASETNHSSRDDAVAWSASTQASGTKEAFIKIV